VPTIKFIGQYRFFFASSDGSEPPHVHIEHDGKVAKFWLQPVKNAKTGRLAQHQLSMIERLVSEHQVEFLKVWHDFFGR